MYNIVVYLCEF